ncbi:MAG: transcription antitermination factor NusB [Balneolaceae bacterium]|nr:MAG: transcription antitermination factor NusB [Balneolaceae bacterium]
MAQNRRNAREAALKALYAVEVGSNTTQDATKWILKPALESETESVSFAEKLLLITVDHKEEQEEIIEQHIRNWDVKRLAIMDKLILRMALSELLYFEEIPSKVSINEAIDLAKLYSTRKSGTFVNGILDAALKSLNEEGKINKKGRGLIDVSRS